MSRDNPDQARQAGRALDAANFFLADVRDGLGPYLAVYLLTEQHWDEARIGLVMSISTIAGIVAQTPAGALVDATRAKRTVMVIAAVMVTLASLSLPLFPTFGPVAISQGIAQAAAVIFLPAIAAISLGIFGHAAFTRRIGRNETFNHAGNAVAAGLAGVSAYWFGPTVVFYLLGAMAIASLVSILAIPERAIDHDLARGLDDADAQSEQPSGLAVLLTCRPLLVFAICVLLFHLSNAAMLPLVGQKLALQDKNMGTSLMSACIVAAQLVMVPFAMLVGAKADRWGHKRFFVAALLILPVRARALYALGQSVLAGRRPAARRRRRRHFWRDLPGDRRRPHAQHGSLQRRARCCHNGPEHWRRVIDDARRLRRGRRWLQRGLHHARHNCGNRRRDLPARPPRKAANRRRRSASAGEDSGVGFRYRCQMNSRHKD
ncbi:MFS family permease [Bradyrhizobium sp. AZCC 2230]